MSKDKMRYFSEAAKRNALTAMKMEAFVEENLSKKNGITFENVAKRFSVSVRSVHNTLSTIGRNDLRRKLSRQPDRISISRSERLMRLRVLSTQPFSWLRSSRELGVSQYRLQRWFDKTYSNTDRSLCYSERAVLALELETEDSSEHSHLTT